MVTHCSQRVTYQKQGFKNQSLFDVKISQEFLDVFWHCKHWHNETGVYDDVHSMPSLMRMNGGVF